MIRSILVGFFTIGTALTLVTTVSALDWTLAVDVPFDFNVGDVKMASGSYTVQIIGDGVLVIRSVDRQKAALILSNAATRPSRLQNGGLVFNSYGDQYFLSTVSWGDGPSRMIPPTSHEIRAARNTGDSRKRDVAIK